MEPLPPVRVLFPASPPKRASRLEKACQTVAREYPEVQLVWRREVQARRPDDPTDYLAGTDSERCAELLDFLADPEAMVGWFGRGGYGVTRLLSRLARNLPQDLPKKDKCLVGYSDITALFSFIKSQGLPVQCIHGPMLCAFHEQPNRDLVIRSLHRDAQPIEVMRAEPHLEFQGSLWGGNLAVLASLAGTPWLATPAANQAVFLEDVDEPPYRLDRFLTQLFDCGFFSKTKRVFLGTFTGFAPPEAALGTVLKRCEQLGLTVLGHLPIGHSEPHTPLFLDREYRYDASTQQLRP